MSAIISRTAEARVAKFYMQVEYIKCYAWDDILPPNGRGQGHLTRFLKFCPQSYLYELSTSNVICWL